MKLAKGTDSCTASVNVDAGVRLSCSAEPEQLVVPGEVHFGAQAVGGDGRFSYAWDFGDGGTASEKDPVHRYEAEGERSVHVTATSGRGAATCTRTVHAFKGGLSVSCSGTPTDGHVPLNVRFRSSATGGSGRYDVRWQFGDGDLSFNPNPEHTYSARGLYKALVTVQSANQGGSCEVRISADPPIVCGDRKVEGAEACDDGDTTAGDGCSATCAIETGYTCAGAPSVCTTTCGDGIPAGAETCDDGNTAGTDGCSATCAPEHAYTCAGTPSVCSATCGDGLIAAAPVEECDDDNTANGDGCDSTCKVEPTFTCVGEPSVCT